MNLTAFIHRSTAKPRVAPHAVRSTREQTTGGLFMRAESIFESAAFKRGNVWLPNGKDKVISVRREHVGDDGRYYLNACYRANVIDTRTKECRFVELHPGNMLKVAVQ